MSIVSNIAKDVAKNIQGTNSLELIVTIGSAIQNMFIDDKTLKQDGLYLVKFHENGTLQSYQLLPKEK